jgi:RNA 2',3'-cyclic 3'-phosphodiesterase
VNAAASVGSGDSARLFCALALPDPVLDRLVAWQALIPPGRFRAVPRENLHVTLAFLGSRPSGELPAILDVLGRAAVDSEPVRFDVTGYRETRSVGMLTLADEAGGAARLARRLHDELEALGVYRREARPWLPHVTVLRFRERPRLRPEPPALGWVSSDAAALLSRLHPSGARYEVHDSFRLGG